MQTWTLDPAPELTPDDSPAGKRTRETYPQLVQRLSRQSVRKHFDAYADVPWDDPEYRIDPEDPRWELTEHDVLGATRWYRNQPASVRSQLGLNLVVNAMKTGALFESVLKRGLLEFATTLPNGSPEFRYVYHEVIEEAQHSLMFQEFVNRSGFNPKTLRGRKALAARRIVGLGRRFPALFFIFVLGGEAPIDHAQRRSLRQRDTIHPLLRRIMQIHVTEEARHLCFAQHYLRDRVPKLSTAQKSRLALTAPLVLHAMAKEMLQPPHGIIRRYGIPASVVAEAYTHNPQHRRNVAESLASVRELCEELGLMPAPAAYLWRKQGLVV